MCNLCRKLMPDRIDSGKDQQTVVGYGPLLLLHRLEFFKQLIEHSQNMRRHIGLPLAVWKHYTDSSGYAHTFRFSTKFALILWPGPKPRVLPPGGRPVTIRVEGLHRPLI